MPKVKESILKLLSEYPEGIPQSLIHKLINASKSRVSEVLADLERAGIIIRVKLGKQYIVKLRSGTSSWMRHRKLIRLGVVWSSEYPFIAPLAKILKNKFNIELDVTVFPNALVATWALVSGDVDLVLSPLITQLYAYSLTKSLKIIGGGAYGGAIVFENMMAKGRSIASSELSTMDACRSVVKHELPDIESTIYFSKPEDEVVKLVREGSTRYFVVWHPLTERLRELGLKRIARCDELGVVYCCTLASSVRVEWDVRRRISKAYNEALEIYRRDPKKWVEWYSIKVGIPKDVVLQGLTLYKLKPYVDVNEVARMLQNIGVSIPSYEVIKRAVELH